MAKFSGALPSGSRTNRTKQYVDEWRYFADCVCETIKRNGEGQWRPFGYEPGLTLIGEGRTIHLEPLVARVLARESGWAGD